MSDDWDVYFLGTEDGPVSFFVDLNARGEETPGRPLLCRVSVRLLAPSEHGFASREEDEVLFRLEDALEARLGETCGAQYVGRATSGGVRVYFFYLPEGLKPEGTIRECLGAFGDYREKVALEDDPEWAHYFEFLYPDTASLQGILNRRVVQNLIDNGDQLHRPRRVDHWLYFADRASAERFQVQAKRMKFEIEDLSPSGGEWKLQIYRTDPVDQDSIDETTIQLCELVDGLGGRYDGWETEVIKGA
ncbi:MAG: DUF695 domain-containing protein [Thermoanaerobaculia bacterium]|nr:DUF695 domain-containing protein [Thermoanaerobaculia bacterium]